MKHNKTKIPEVVLRDLIEGDLDLFFEHLSDPVANYMAAFTSRDPKDRKAFDEKWKKIRSSQDTIVKAIIFKKKLAGHIAKFLMFSKPEITYWIGKEFWGRGIATQACMMFLKEIKERPLYARAAKDNIGSTRVLEKCGFVKTGIEKAYANARNQEIEEIVYKLL